MFAHSTNQTYDEKYAALRAAHALHPHPERVCASVFNWSEFFDPRDGVQVKYEMLRQVQIESASVTLAAAAHGYSRVTWHHSQRRFEQLGLLGLLPACPGPREGRILTDRVVGLLIEHHATHPDETTAALAAWMHMQQGIVIHARSVGRALRPSTCQRVKKRWRPSMPQAANACASATSSCARKRSTRASRVVALG